MLGKYSCRLSILILSMHTRFTHSSSRENNRNQSCIIFCIYLLNYLTLLSCFCHVFFFFLLFRLFILQIEKINTIGNNYASFFAFICYNISFLYSVLSSYLLSLFRLFSYKFMSVFLLLGFRLFGFIYSLIERCGT